MEKSLHPQLIRKRMKGEVETWNWLGSGTLKKETGGMLITATDQALRTNNRKRKVVESFASI